MVSRSRIKKIACRFEMISQYFISEPDLLKVEGIFRESGLAKNSLKIIDFAKNNKKLSSKKTKHFTAHDYADALKRLLKDEEKKPYCLLSKNCSALKKFIDEIEQQDAKPLANLVQSLSSSKKKHYQAVADIICHYFNLAQKVVDAKIYNKMTAENMAIILAPFLYDSILHGENIDQKSMINKISKLTEICVQALNEKQLETEICVQVLNQEKLEITENNHQLEPKIKRRLTLISNELKEFATQNEPSIDIDGQLAPVVLYNIAKEAEAEAENFRRRANTLDGVLPPIPKKRLPIPQF